MKKKLAITASVIVTLFTLYSGIGFLLLPYLAKSIIAKELKQSYDIAVHIEKIALNPFSFKARVENLSFEYQDEPLIRFQKLELDFHPLAFIKNKIHLSHLFIDTLELNVELDEEGAVNFVKIFTQNDSKEDESESKFIFLLSNFELANSYLHFRDKSNGKDFHTSFGPIAHNFQNFSTQYNSKSTHISNYDLGDFGQLEIDATMQLFPFGLEASINHQNKQLQALDYFLANHSINFDSGTNSYEARIKIETNETTTIVIEQFLSKLEGVKLNVDGVKTLDLEKLILDLDNLQIVFNDELELMIEKGDLWATGLELYDNTFANTSHKIDKLDAQIQDFDLAKRFDFNATLAQENNQTITADAKIDLAKSEFDIDLVLSHILLQHYNPYLENFANFFIENAKADASINIFVDSSEELKLQTDGNIKIKQLQVVDNNKEPLMSFENFLTHYKFDLLDNFLTLGETAVDGLELHFVNHKEETNFDNLFKTTNERNEQTQPFGLSVKSFELNDSKVWIKDRADFEISLNLLIHPITQGEISNLDIQGKIDQFSDFELSFFINPFDFKQFTKGSAQLEGLNLQKLTPYAYGAIGREILQGRLGHSFEVAIEDEVLQSNHSITINNLSVSSHIQESGARELPIRLAIALLQNRDRVINLNIDVNNDLNDPEFQPNRVILTVLTNVINSTVSSPFSLLGSLVGLNAREISEVEFVAGVSSLDRSHFASFDRLISAMRQRPQLHLKICPSYDEIADTKALQKIRLNNLLINSDFKTIAKEFEIEIDTMDEAEVFEAIAQQIFIEKQTLKHLATTRAQAIESYMKSHGLTNISMCENINTTSTTVRFDLSLQ